MQSNVDSSLDCSLALGMVATETRGSFVVRRATGTLPWISVNDPAEEQRPQADHAVRSQSSSNLAVQKSSLVPTTRSMRCRRAGLTDRWYMDDEDIMCHPILVLPFLQDFDVVNVRVGAERNPLKTEVI